MIAQPAFKLKELDYSGASHLYTSTPSRINVVEVTLTVPVDGNALQLAVEDTLERMPYFADALKEIDGLFYYAENPLPFVVCEGGPRAVGGPETNWHLVDVSYEGSVMHFSMFHAFCDGQGMNFFVEATLYHYFCRRDGTSYPSEGIRAKGTPMLEGEELDFASAVTEVQLNPDAAAQYKGPALDRCVLPEVAGNLLGHIHASVLRVREDEFVSFARSCGSSPAPTIAALMADAILDVHPELEGDITALIPASARTVMQLPNTFKNCSMAARLHFDTHDAESMGFAERASRARASMRMQLDPSLAAFAANGIHQGLAAAQSVPGYADKRRMLNGNGNSSPVTFVLDYLGKMRLGGYEDQIASIRFLASGADDGNGFLTFMVSATGGIFEILTLRNFEADVYDSVLATQLKEHGLRGELGEDFTFLTPRNGLIPALGLA